jgi:hypothetical protein
MKKQLFTIALTGAALTVVGAAPIMHQTGKSTLPAPAGVPVTSAQSAPRYLPIDVLKKLQRRSDPRKMVIGLQPLIDGKSLKGQDRRDLITNPPLQIIEANAETGAETAVSSSDGATVTETALNSGQDSGMDGVRIAQGPRRFPTPVAPARPRPQAPRTVIPRWVRYPLEFQLCGIGLGIKAVDKDQYNRIDRFGLFAIHGNPTAVVVPSATGNIQVNQQPPEVSAQFRDDNPDYLPNWAAAVTVQLDNNHVEWLYRRDTYSMGFVVDRLGYVDAIVVAGVQSPIARTQLEDPIHTVKLGDDLRKVLFRYGYPDTIETYTINYAAGVAVGAAGGGGEAGAGAEGAAGAAGAAGAGGAGAAGAGGGGAAAAAATGGGAANAAVRTFEVRYEQSYNVVFTIRNNRVVRIYIFGDPDFFNRNRRGLLRTEY